MKVFVTVGTTKFDGLIDLFDDPDFVKQLKYMSKLTIQYGHSKEPRMLGIPLEAFSLTNRFSEYVADADLVISPASAGVRLDVLQAQKPHLMLANRTLHGDHQREMVLANRGKTSVFGFLEVEELKKFLLDFSEQKLAAMRFEVVDQDQTLARALVEETMTQKHGNALWKVFSVLVVLLYAFVQLNKLL